MISRTIKSRALSIWMAAVLVLGIFMGMPVSAGAEEALPIGGTTIGASGLSAPQNLRWNGATGTAAWDKVENAGKFEESYETYLYYRWELYRLSTDRNITSANDLNSSEQVRYGGVYDDPTGAADLSEWITEEGYYYLTVFAYGDGVSFTDSPMAVSNAFHYTVPQDKLPTPMNLRWQKHETKYYGVWDNIFGDEFINAGSFLVKCYDESGEIYTHSFKRDELIKDRDEKGRPGTMLWMNEPNGKYRFKVQAVSSDITKYKSSDWSELSETVEVRPSTPILTPTPGGGGSTGGSGSGSDGGLGFSSGSAAPAAPASRVQTPDNIKALASTVRSRGETVARSKGTGEVTVKGSAWSQLKGLSFQHDTVSNGAVQVRVTINNPTALSQDIKVSAYVTGKDVKRVKSHFDKYFSNATSVMHFDQTGEWGQEVQIAAKLDLDGMDNDNLVFYSYDKATNSYRQIENPGYSVDTNGYTHFRTPYAGDIIVSDGPLSKK